MYSYGRHRRAVSLVGTLRGTATVMMLFVAGLCHVWLCLLSDLPARPAVLILMSAASSARSTCTLSLVQCSSV